MAGESDRREFKDEADFRAWEAAYLAPYIWTFGEWQFNWAKGKAGGIHLDRRESDVLLALCRGMPHPMTGAEVAKEVVKLSKVAFDAENVKVYVRRLRLKLGEGRILTEGRRYEFVPFP